MLSFDNVSHSWLLKFLQVRIKDPSLLLLIRRFLKAGYLEAGRIVATEQGTPQGGNEPDAFQHLSALRIGFVVREADEAAGTRGVLSGAICG